MAQPAPSASPFSERVLGTVMQDIFPTISDGVTDGSVIAQRLLVGGIKPWNLGPQMWKNIKVSTSTQGGSFSGLDKLDTAAEELNVRLAFDPKGFTQPVVIPGIEESLNMTDAGKIRLLTQKLEEASIELRDKWTTAFHADGTGNSGKDPNGLGNLVDDGTTSSTHGTQSRTTFPVLASNVVTGVGELSLDHMAAQVNAASRTGGTRTKPTLIVTDEAGFDAFEKLALPTQRLDQVMTPMPQLFSSGPMQMGQTIGANLGFNALSYRGIPVVADESVPSGTMYFLNENDLAFYNLKGARLESAPVQGANQTYDDSPYTQAPTISSIQFKPWAEPHDQYGTVGHLIVLGNVILWNPRLHAKSQGIS